MENGTQSGQDTGKAEVNAAAPEKNRPRILDKRVFYLAAAFAGMLAAKLFFNLAFSSGRRPEPPAAVPPAAETEALSDPAASPAAGGDNLSALSASVVPDADNAAENAAKPASPPLLVLNGTFLSDGEEFAIINNQIVKTGDEIDGAAVKRIRANNVELEFDGKPLYITSEEN